jgi:ribosomal protein S18 acetylase RimI-like enzyme
MTMDATTSGAEVIVRSLRPADLEAVVALDARITGGRREEYFKGKLTAALHEPGVHISLAAEEEGRFRGFLLARLWYGEFGVPAPVASLDTLGVHPDFRGRGIGAALLAQLRRNLRALGVGGLRTEVGWDDQDLISFFHHEGFRPAARLCLDLDLAQVAEEGDEARAARARP